MLITEGCGFHLRGTQNLPPQLHTLYLDIEKPDSPLSQSVRALLLSLHITLVSSPSAAPYTLHIGYEFSHSNPTITSSTQTVSYSFRLQMTAQINNNEGKVIVPSRIITIAHSLVMNSNQIYIPNTATFVEAELGRDAVNLLYFWLTNKNTHLALNTNGAEVNVNAPATPPPTTSASTSGITTHQSTPPTLPPANLSATPTLPNLPATPTTTATMNTLPAATLPPGS